MMAYRRSRHTALLILNLGTRWGRVVNFRFRPLYYQEITAIPIG